MRSKLVVALGLTAALLLVAASAYLALHRVYQVDEVQTVFMTRIAGRGEWGQYRTHAPLFILGPLAALARGAEHATRLLDADRLVFLAVLWANVALLAAGTGVRARTPAALVLFLAAATLAPLWDYGFEIRHDNLLLLGILLIWWLGARGRPLRGPLAYGLIGVVAVWTQLGSYKAFLYWVPLVGLLLAFPHPSFGSRRAKLGLGFAAGAAAGAALAFAAYLRAGALPAFVWGFRQSTHIASSLVPFSAVDCLLRVAREAPLLVVGSLVALSVEAVRLRREPRRFASWDGRTPEILFFLASLAVLLLNPSPFPYNAVLLVPQAFLLAATLRVERVPPRLAAPVAVAVALAHLAPFARYTLRHLDYPNSRQRVLIEWAERMTDPEKDRVYDAAGMVATRHSIGFQWFLHSQIIESFRDGTYPPVRAMLASRPAAVLIRSYRTDWLPEADWAFIRAHYVALSGDFYVLGTLLPPGGGEWNCLHTGRYRVSAPGSVAPVTIDGIPARETPVSLDAGGHTIRGPRDARILVVWVGPRLDAPPALGPGDRPVFAGFY